jgi:hypothetical protein
MRPIELYCRECGRRGTITDDLVTPAPEGGLATTGLDPDNCDGCRQAIAIHGYAPVTGRTMAGYVRVQAISD